MENYIIIVFRSRMQVMHFKKLLASRGVNGEIISTPREIKIGCGLSVKIKESDLSVAKSILEGVKFTTFVGIYEAIFDGYGMHIIKKTF